MKPSAKAPSAAHKVVEVDTPLIRVSTHSIWPDYSWRLDTTTPGQTNRMFWDFALPDGSRSTDSQHQVLLESFREVCWGMLEDGGWYGAALSPGSGPAMSAGSKELFCWMNYRGLRDFGELTEEAWAQYHSDLPTLLLNRLRFYDDKDALYGSVEWGEVEDAADEEGFNDDDATGDQENEIDETLNEEQAGDTATPLDEDDKITYNQVSTRIKLAYYIYAQRSRLEKRGLPCTDLVPFAGRKVNVVAGELAAHVIKRIPPLPDEIAQLLLKAALKWVDEYAPDVIRLQNTYLDAREEAIEKGLARSTINKYVRTAISGFSFNSEGSCDGSWRDQLTAFNTLIQDGRETIFRQVEALRYFIVRVRTAAVCILQYLVGLRGSEICGLTGGWNEEKGLPVCISRRLSSNGLMEMFYLQGVVSKGRPDPKETEWLLGCRPVGADYLPPPVRAVCTLEKLLAPWRILGGRSELVVHFVAGRGVAWNPKKITAFKITTLLRTFKSFVASEVNFNRLPFDSKRGEDLSIYIATGGRCITPSQGRKTFAAYVLDVRTSLLPAVRQHFKHYSDATTESAYYPADARQRRDVDDLIESETINFFVAAVQGEKLTGRMSDVIAEYFSREQFTGANDYAECVRRVTEVVTTHDLRIFFSDHGNCFIRAKPLESRCRAASGTVSWGATVPDFSSRNPGMCAACGCFAIDVTHLNFWAERHEHYAFMVRRAKRAGREREFAVHKARADQAEKVVAVLIEAWEAKRGSFYGN